MKVLIPFLAIPLLAACDPSGLLGGRPDETPDAMSQGADAAPGEESYSSTGEPWQLRPRGRGQDDLPAAGATPVAPGAGGLLGRSVASLGAAGEPGLWVKTPLVRAPAQGRVRALDTGREIAVELRPAAGASGARLSLQAMQGLGLPLTALSEVEIYGG